MKKIAAFFLAACMLIRFGVCVPDGTKVTGAPEMLFARLDEKETMAKVQVIMDAQKAAALKEFGPAPEEKQEEEPLTHKPEITFDDFGKFEFRVGEIISCEPVPKSKKLLCSQVKIGPETRQIVSGIHAYYTPEEMVGKKVMVLVNLKPAKLAGVLSEGMILCADGKDGEIVLMKPEKDIPSGGEIS